VLVEAVEDNELSCSPHFSQKLGFA